MTGGHYEPQAFGKYLLTERIGAGGMAEIFRATAFGVEGFTKEVCIKRILPTLTADDTFIKMFIDEAKISVTLHHHNIVQVFDLGRIGEHYFIAMELVRGRDLLQIINHCRAKRERLPVHIALFIISEVCKGLDYAHRVKSEGRPLGIIHRDVSPSNIMVSWEGEVKVADFGIAKAAALKDQKTITGTLKGKYGYMSPEQVCGQPIDHRSDIFSVGILLYEALVGKRLFKGETDLETLEKVKSAVVPAPPSTEVKKVPLEVDQIVLKALALDPKERYQNAGELHDALADHLFSGGNRVDSKVLGHFLQELFADEIRLEEEWEAERKRSGIQIPFPNLDPSFSGGMYTPTPSQTPLTPTDMPTKLDRPAARSYPPSKPRLSSWALGLIGTAIALLVGALVVGGYWLSLKSEVPAVVPRPTLDVAVAPQNPPVKRGALSVSSQPPGAAVRINGRPSGQVTPAVLRDLDRLVPAVVELGLEGYEPWLKTVEFGDAEVVALDAQLVRLPDKPPLPPEPVVAKPKLGTLNINAVPVWAYVYLNGKQLPNPTPLYNLKLKPGTYEIRLENPRLKLSKTAQVTIKAGQEENLVVEMTP